MALKRINRIVFVTVLVATGLVAGAITVYMAGKEKPSPDQSNMSQSSPFISRFISQIVFDPQNPNILYMTVVSQGVFKSTDKGTTWKAVNKGIKNLLVFHLAIDPFEPNTLYIGTFGGGVYRSDNGGASWIESNNGLTNTTIEGLFLHPAQRGVLYVAATNGELFRSHHKRKTWTSFNQGLPWWEHNHLQSFISALPTDPTTLFFASYAGLYKRTDTFIKKADKWEATGVRIQGAQITSFLYDPRQHVFYLTTRTGRLFKSPDGEDWSLVNDQLLDYAFYSIVLDPSNSNTLFAAVGSKGIIKSIDQGATWNRLNEELGEKDVRSLSVDPENSKTLYAGTKKEGLWVSYNGGERWVEVTALPVLDWAVLMESVQPPRPTSPAQPAKNGQLPVPKEFEKCNTCHGWSDSVLNSNWHTFWLVTPTYRDWKQAVERMRERSKLTPEEAVNILQYLNKYYGVKRPLTQQAGSLNR